MIDLIGIRKSFDGHKVLQDCSLHVERGETVVVIGRSGTGKSVLLKHLVGLLEPDSGQVLISGENAVEFSPVEWETVRTRFGVLFQSGALWSSMTLAENVTLPLGEYTNLSLAEIRDVVSLKLALVGLKGFEEFYPSEISGGMQKRAGIARAMALDPEILFFDEPSAGLDPVSARRLDDLILQLSEILGTTMVVVTHELASIFTIGSNSVFLDASKRTMTATGDPKKLLAETRDPTLRLFLTRGEKG